MKNLALLTVVWGHIAVSALACASRVPPSETPATSYPTWRCVLMDQAGKRTVTSVEMPKLYPYIALTGCDERGLSQVENSQPSLGSLRVARMCSGVEVRRRLFRFASLEVDSMTATYRATER